MMLIDLVFCSLGLYGSSSLSDEELDDVPVKVRAHLPVYASKRGQCIRCLSLLFL
jgi:hypothetical protein